MLMSEEYLLSDLRSEAARVTSVCDPSEAVEVDARVQSCIVAFNQLSKLIDESQTKFKSSLVLWQRFKELSGQTAGWAKETEVKVERMNARPDQQDEETVKVRGASFPFHETQRGIRRDASHWQTCRKLLMA